MTLDLIKAIAPVFFVISWLVSYRKSHGTYLNLSLLLLASYASMSSNFSFFYREAFQFFQLVSMVILCIHFFKFRTFNKVMRFFLGLYLIAVSSIVFSVFDMDARTQILNLLAVTLVASFLSIAIRGKDEIVLLLLFLSKIAVIAACVGIFEFFACGSDRVEATFSNSNYYAYFLGLGVCVVLVGRPRFMWIKFALICAAIVMSGSRSALIFPFLHFAWRGYISKRLTKKVVMFVVFVMLGTLLASAKFVRMNDSKDVAGSDLERLAFAGVAYRMALDHPLAGVGWGRFPAEFSKYATKTDIIYASSGAEMDISQQDRRVTHNDFMRILAELGFMAGLLTVFYAIRIGVIAFSIREEFFVCIFPMWMGNIFFSLTHNNLNSFIFWLIFLLPVIFLQVKNQLEKNVHSANRF